jgi:uncharacterized protein
MRRFLFIIALFAAGASAVAQTLNFPQQTGRVTDDAGILDSSTRAALVQTLAALEAKNTSQLFVATVKSLQGDSIEDYANRLFRQWGIGQKGKNNGVLLLVAPNERKVRIEVGYGLEGTLTDAQTKVIIENAIIPRFRAGDFPGGIIRGVDNLVALMSNEAGAPPARPLFTLPKLTHGQMAFVWVGGFMFFWCLGMFLAMRNNMRHPHRYKPARHYSGSSSSSYWSSSSSDSSSSWGSSGSSSSSDSSSGGGGDSGGGGSSGSW